MLSANTDPRLLARFTTEVRSTASLKHAHIATIYDVNGDAPQPYYVMEYALLGTLADRLAGRPYPPREAAEILADLAEAVQYCHDQGWIHRDLKPANVLLTDIDGRVVPKISDFGLVKRTGSEEAKLTKTGEVLGTPSYMAPEQAGGVTTIIGPAVDVYALGAILYECLTGRPPFIGTEPVQVVLQVIGKDPLRPRWLEPAIPKDLETIALKCLEKAPRKRYARAADLSADLRHWLAGEPIAARPTPHVERAWTWTRRRPWQATALVACAALLVGSVIAAVVFDRKARELSDTNGKLVRSKSEADRMLDVVLVALDKYYFDLSDQLQDIPRGEKLRREVIDQARVTVRKIETLRPNDPALRVFQAQSLLKLGAIELQDDHVAEARDAFDRASELFGELAQSNPEYRPYRVKEATATFRAAQARQLLGEAGAAELLASAMAAADSLYRDAPEDADVLLLAAVAASERFKSALAAGKQEAQTYLQQTVDFRRHRATLLANDPAALAESVSAELVWGEWLVVKGKPAEAEATIRAALNRLKERGTDSIAYRRLQVLALQSLSRIAEKRSDFTAAMAAHQDIVTLQRQIVEDRPGASAPKRDLIAALREYARAAEAAGKADESRKARDEAERIQNNLGG
jgi:hypothetical protein